MYYTFKKYVAIVHLVLSILLSIFVGAFLGAASAAIHPVCLLAVLVAMSHPLYSSLIQVAAAYIMIAVTALVALFYIPCRDAYTWFKNRDQLRIQYIRSIN